MITKTIPLKKFSRPGMTPSRGRFYSPKFSFCRAISGSIFLPVSAVVPGGKFEGEDFGSNRQKVA